MNIGNLLRHLTPEEKKLIRNTEKQNSKINNIKLSLIFNKTCINEKLLPTYTNIVTHDPAARDEQITVEYRRQLVQRQIELKEADLLNAETTNSTNYLKISSDIRNDELRSDIVRCLKELRDQHYSIGLSRIKSKLNRLYRGKVCLIEECDSYINLSDTTLTENQKKFLNLGLKCHLQPKYSTHKKKIELEMLYESLIDLERNNKIVINPDLKDQLRGESTRRRSYSESKLMTPELKEAAKQLRENPDIVIKKADKSNIFVIINKEEYLQKVNNILNDTSKFEKINRDPTEPLQRKVNKLIDAANAEAGHKILTPIVGNYTPGYFYGNIKTHKPGNPLRPIISQVTTATYDTSKQLDKIIKKYIPKKYSLKSRDEFIELLQANQPDGTLASLDVTSLFTNVPVRETIEIILENVYNHENLVPPPIPRNILEQLLLACTTESPFRCPNNKLYYQKDGIAMGCCLAPTFAEYYMCNLENDVLSNNNIKPSVYCRYVDDIYVVVRNEEHLFQLKTRMEEQSALQFTYEMSANNILPFLDINVSIQNGQYSLSVHRKTTDKGKCMNPSSECPDRYKRSVIRAYLYRAHKTCSDMNERKSEIERCKQILINNGFTNREVDKEINGYRNTANASADETNEVIKLFYENQMTNSYKTDERVLNQIIERNVNVLGNARLKVIVYYKNIYTKHHVIKNSPSTQRSALQKTNVVYKISCPDEDCVLLQNVNYIGMTCTTLSRRITCHLTAGAPKEHFRRFHGVTVTRKMLEDNVSILNQVADRRRLAISEALLIEKHRPAINNQFSGSNRILKLF